MIQRFYGGSFVYNGTTYDGSNLTGTETLTASNGCDSIVTVTVIESPAITSTVSVTICTGQTYTTPQGTVVTIIAGSGTTTEVINGGSVTGCDSTITYNVMRLLR